MKDLIVNWVINRLKEKSTYAGLGALAVALGLKLSDVDVDGLIQILVAIGGFVAVIIKEKTNV